MESYRWIWCFLALLLLVACGGMTDHHDGGEDTGLTPPTLIDAGDDGAAGARS
jgi:hypothetical protein